MKSGFKLPLVGLACMAAVALPQTALACGVPALTGTSATKIAPELSAPANLAPANDGYGYGSNDGFRWEGERTMIGLWSFKFTANGNTVDFGYVQWHSDGTELMNSGGRAPATENFCMGVWRQTAPARFHLNHVALSYDTTGTLNARVVIKEDVTVDAGGQTFSGSFTLDVYDPKTNGLLQHIAGQATGQRILPN
jgi:hypothetical protein